MAALNVGSASAQGSAAGARSIDCHVHWAPEAYVRELARLTRPAGT
jgi:hypothetical protein